MNDRKLKNTVIMGLFWKFMERGGSQFIQFIISIILARILTPSDYGIIGLIVVFITIGNVFVQSGFSTALIQRKKVDHLDYSSVFYFSLAISFIVYFVLFLCAPLIASFYSEPMLVNIIRVQAIVLILGGIGSVHMAIINKRMQFRKSFVVSLCGAIGSGIVGIGLAISGFGVWSLVYSQITNVLINTVILWSVVKWRPTLAFSIERIQILFGFGSKLLVSNLLDVGFNNIHSLIIGRYFNKSVLGYYNRGINIPNLLVNNITGSISGVMLPTLSLFQHDLEQLKRLMRKSIITSCYLIFPMMFGLLATAEPLTIILLTDKWLDSVPFMQIACITYCFYPIHTANLQAINAVGRSDIFLQLEIFKKMLIIFGLIISVPFGVYAMVISNAVISILSTIINAYPNSYILKYTYLEQMKDIAPSFILSIIMCGVVYMFNFLDLNVYLTLGLQVVTGVMIYLLFSHLFHFESYEYLKSTIKAFLKR